MALTGLFLITFLVVHLVVNLFSLVSDPQLFNDASHFMGHNPVIQIMQYVLAAGFIFHIVMGMLLTVQNNKLRQQSTFITNLAPTLAGLRATWLLPEY
mgnify:CR=1 FL=1